MIVNLSLAVPHIDGILIKPDDEIRRIGNHSMPGHLCGKRRSDKEPKFKYHIRTKDECFS